ncbi:hypothetical protein TSAR_009589 [Trichomalopsis sarcophagae]|uniref:Uncharacterized protein n=1 Tax=Trichomalopsis sarcophagae TaxID=543379 RepID=A0A232ES24_9HYME|nr:hypothetical protein TSAR_009589 [Trichomalopsis sarcophagae]
MLQEYRPMREFYKGIVKADDDSVGLVFIHESISEALSECTQLFCDGTFDVCISNFIYFYHIDVFFLFWCFNSYTLYGYIREHPYHLCVRML